MCAHTPSHTHTHTHTHTHSYTHTYTHTHSTVNYRGSAGYGQDSIFSLPGKAGTQDVNDVQVLKSSALVATPHRPWGREIEGEAVLFIASVSVTGRCDVTLTASLPVLTTAILSLTERSKVGGGGGRGRW